MALPTGKQTSKGGNTPREAGVYHAQLKGIYLETNKEFKSEAFNDGEGLRFQACRVHWDIDGENYTERFVRLSTGENSTFYNRIAALLGRDLVAADEGKGIEGDLIDWDVATDAVRNLALDQDDDGRATYFRAKEDILLKDTDGNTIPGPDGKPQVKHKKDTWVIRSNDTSYVGIEGNLIGVKIGGEELIGKECLLELTVRGDWNRTGRDAATALPKRRGRVPAAEEAMPAGMPT